MKVLVIGGSGFVGSHVAHAFVRAGHDVRSLSRREPRFGEMPGVDYMIGDAGRDTVLASAMKGIDVLVFSLTATTPASAHAFPEVDLATNVGNGLRALDAAARERVKRVVLLSSAGTVYGIPQALPLAESHPTNPISAYGASRLTLEKYFGVFCFQTKIETTILRISNAIGERQSADSGQGAAAAFLAAITQGAIVEIWGDGSIVRDYVYAGDVADACVRAAQLPDAVRRGKPLIVNIGSGVGTPLIDLLGACSNILGREAEIAWMPTRVFDVPAIVLDVGKAADILAWTPQTPIQQGLERAAASLPVQKMPTLASGG